jgi:hypothetical protein
VSAWWLYARSRQAGGLLGALVFVGAGGAALAGVTDRFALAPVLPVLLAMSAGALIGVSLHSPFGSTEQPLRYGPLARARLLHSACAYACALAVLLPAAWRAGTGCAAAATARGLLGFEGAAMVCAVLLGAARSWIPVLCLGIAVMSLPLPAAGAGWLWGWAGTQGGGASAWASALAVQALAWLTWRRRTAGPLMPFPPGARAGGAGAV